MKGSERAIDGTLRNERKARMDIVRKTRVERGREAKAALEADRARGKAHGPFGCDMDRIGPEIVDRIKDRLTRKERQANFRIGGKRKRGVIFGCGVPHVMTPGGELAAQDFQRAHD